MTNFFTAALLFLSVSPCIALTGIETLGVEDDAYIDEGNADTNYGGNPTLRIGRLSGYFIDTLIKFDDVESYEGVTLSSAILRMYVYMPSPGVDDNYINRITEDWDENLVTWNNKPGKNNAITVNFDDPLHEGWIELDVTEIVETWLDGSFPHNGFYIGATISFSSYIVFVSKEGSENYRPELILYYSSAGVEPSSFGRVKTAFR
jgi:hypothetical protein